MLLNDRLDALDALINNELLLHYINNHQQHNLLYLWQTPPTVILGPKDLTIPQITSGLQFLKQQHYQYIVRNSGGLAVVSDPGVINLSLFLHNDTNLTIDQAYQRMITFISEYLAIPFQTGEISHSYCPGRFDLSINQTKFAGISQRRLQNGIVVMIYLSLTGNQEQRSNLVKSFYKISSADQNFPRISPTAMANLDDFDINTDNFITSLNNYINNQNLQQLTPWLQKEETINLKQKIKSNLLARQQQLFLKK